MEAERDGCLTSAENHLIQVQAIFAAALAIASVFLSLYLFTVGGFRAIAHFYIGQYLFMPPAFAVAGYVMRRRSSRDVIRAGLLILCVLFGLLLVLGPEARSAALLLGIVMGIGEGLYWPGINLGEYMATHTRTRHVYYGKLFLLSNLASVIGLPLSGLVISVSDAVSTTETGYYVLFVALIALLLLTHHFGAELAPWSGVTFSLGDIVRHKRSNEWKLVLAQNVLRGLWAYALPAFAAVLLFLIVNGELALSIVTAFTTVIMAAASFVAGRALQRHPWTFLLGAIVVPIGLVGFAYQQNWFGIFCYAVLIWGFDPFAQNFTYKAMYDVMEKESESWRDSYHFILEREMAWNTGRVLSFLVALWVLEAGDQAGALASACAIAAVFPVVVGVLQYRLHRMVPHLP